MIRHEMLGEGGDARRGLVDMAGPTLLFDEVSLGASVSLDET